MASSHHFDLQHFDEWWNESNPAHTNFSDIPTYHLGKFISDTGTYELFHDHELLAMIPAHYRNGLRFLNHDVICFCWNIPDLHTVLISCSPSMRSLEGNS